MAGAATADGRRPCEGAWRFMSADHADIKPLSFVEVFELQCPRVSVRRDLVWGLGFGV